MTKALLLFLLLFVSVPIYAQTPIRANRQIVKSNTSTSYPVVTADAGKLLTFNNAASVAVSIPRAITPDFPTDWFVDVKNLGAGTVRITPATSTIGGNAYLDLTTGQSARIISNGTNWLVTSTGVTTIAAGDLPTGIDAAKLADGSVSNAEFQRLNSVTSNVQDQIDAKQPLDSDLTAFAAKTAPSGVVVGTTDSQTLTNKTLTSPVVNSPTGIVKGDVGLGNVDNTSDATKNAASVTLTNKTITAPVINSPTGIVKGDVGLGNVDNTSDATKNAASVTLTNKTITQPILTRYTVATLPAGGTAGKEVYVSDGLTATDCTVGGGSTQVLCTYNGSAYAHPGVIAASDLNNGVSGSGAVPLAAGASVTGWTVDKTSKISAFDTTSLTGLCTTSAESGQVYHRTGDDTYHVCLTGGGSTAQLWSSNIIATSNGGGTGNGFTKFSGPTSSEKTFGLPDASATILTTNTAVTAAQGGTGQTTYTKGDILASPGSNTLNKLGVGTDGQVLTADAASTNGIKWATSSGGGSNPFDDGTALVKGSGDATKLLRFEVDGFTTGTTRVITPPNANTSLPVFGQTITFAGPTAARTVTYPDSDFSVASINVAQTFTAAQTNSFTSVASTPAMSYTGTWFSGGSTTTTKPHLLLEMSGATSTGWNANGTGFGINVTSGFTGYPFDVQRNGATQMHIGVTGEVVASDVYVGAANSLGFGLSSNRGYFGATANGVFRMINTATTGFTRLMLGPSGTGYPALAPTGTNAVLEIKTADATAYAPVTALALTETDFTNTTGGTTGAQTINKRLFSVNFAASATSLVVTNSTVTTTTIPICTVLTNDTTMKSVQAVPGSGTLTLFANTAATAETRVGCRIPN